MVAALNTFAALLLRGLVPLVSYLGAGGFVPCVVATGVAFFEIGAIKNQLSLTPVVGIWDFLHRHECRRALQAILR